MKTSKFFGFGVAGCSKVQVKSPFVWKTKSPPRTPITSPAGTSLRTSFVFSGFSGSGMRVFIRMDWTSPVTGKPEASLFKRARMLPAIVRISVSSPLSWVLKRCPSSVGVNAVQKPAVFASVSDLRDVETSATNGTTQMKTINAKTE